MKITMSEIFTKQIWKGLLFVLLTFISTTSVFGQQIMLKGKVLDIVTRKPIDYATIAVIGAPAGNSTSTDSRGEFSLKIDGSYTKFRVTYVGYESQDILINPTNSDNITINLVPEENVLEEVVVKAKKAKYRNKDNPAVELIRKVIDNKEKNRLEAQDYAEFQQYEKISMALSNLSEKFKNRKIFKQYQFLFEKDDSVKNENRYVLPAYIEEKLSQVYQRRSPKKTKQFVIAEQKAQFDPKFVDNNGLSNYFNRLYENIDIYDNNISLLTNQFLSPIAGSSPTFYKFFITDTIKTESPYLVELSFFPRNKADMLFKGKLYITLDGNYAVRKAELTVADGINLNFVRDMAIDLDFSKDKSGRFFLTSSSLAMDFALSEKGTGIRGQRTVSYTNFKTGIVQPDSVYQGPDVVIVNEGKKGTQAFDEQYWSTHRPVALKKNESVIYHNIDTLQMMPSFKRFMDIAALVLSGYKQAGPVEIGPVNTFYSFNPVEGLRLRVGGRTTEAFSKRFYAESYAAYGFKDEKWKYFISGTYSLNNKSVYSFPMHYIRASFQRDTKIPGQNLEFIQEDNFLLSFKRGENERYLYNDIYRLEYKREFDNNLSYTVGFSKWKQQPAGILTYQMLDENGNSKLYNELNTTEISVGVRWAPKEQYYQGKLYRTPIFNKYPIFTLNYTGGVKGLLDGEYNYHNFTGGVFKRFYLSQLGYADVNLEGTYIAGNEIPFPLLTIHRANQTYAYQLNSFNLMNFMEFVSDHSASTNIQYYMNGFILNKIPLVKKLKWREVFSFKAVYGGLRNENNPDITNKVFTFQKNEDNVPISYTFADGRPYMEASVGLYNIFKILRVDAVKRLNYLDHPDAPSWGIRARIKFDF
ncbi:DUF5686 family protein [Sphingobacterium spiritivorum]|uniref:TonB-dependent receptor n=2 Tax=Sphingobacterium spiritivorum TaxID=258 RepID=D7VRA5_SPHSI|nr:hypothetical protein HMPREF0766_13509 [Sphingobacterium spiritivorum ATCC 33861]QQT35606.1 carboxypeptidase-like regulatory domain-containing protein [Sphingobacterium spiritivorum]